MSNYACSNSVLEATNSIVCGSINSCQNSVISSDHNLFCITSSCGNTIIRNVMSIYIIKDQDDDIIIYSGNGNNNGNNNGNSGEFRLSMIGVHAGYGLTYYCDESDTCMIYCVVMLVHKIIHFHIVMVNVLLHVKIIQ